MDEPLIIVFDTLQDAQLCIDAINEVSAAYWVGRGYTVIINPQTGHKELVSKDLHGNDALNACRTTSWDTVKSSPDGSFWIWSLSSDERFSEWKERLSDTGFTAIGVEREFPASWWEGDRT